jgi:4-hydroxybenzoate polyprenyltransferase
MDVTLTLAAPLATRLNAWMKERFAPANALLFFILYLTTAAVARAGAAGGVALSLRDVIGCLVTWSFFLLLRIFDEHKDYELDCRNHPRRVLQSGLITLTHLRVLGVLAILLQLGWSFVQGGSAVLAAWALLFAWTCLMGREFFIADWLTRHLTWYAVSHMLVMPLIVWWLAQLAVPGIALTAPLQLLMLLAFVSGFCFEITRKTKGPEEERDTVESYSRIFGTQGAAWVVIGLVTAMVACQVWLIQVLAGAVVPWALALLAVAFVFALRQLRAFLQAPSAALREKNEAVVALTMLAGYAVLMAVVVMQHGLAARWF